MKFKYLSKKKYNLRGTKRKLKSKFVVNGVNALKFPAIVAGSYGLLNQKPKTKKHPSDSCKKFPF